MISYNWGNQEMVKVIKKGLAGQGFNCWIDVEQMVGSTLEASKFIFFKNGKRRGGSGI
jgi:hypothetical protein